MERFKEILSSVLGGGLGIVSMIVSMVAGPITYILSVVDTWNGDNPIWLKLVINLTIDAILAAIWPITWIFWGVRMFLGHDTPLSILFS